MYPTGSELLLLSGDNTIEPGTGGTGGVVSPTIYKIISDNYGEARTSLLESNSYLFEAVYQVVLLSQIDPEIDLLMPLFSAYQIMSGRFASPTLFIPAVRTLNVHVLKRSGYTNLSSYLTFEDILVSPSWQVLSEAAGYHINDNLVEGS